MAEAHQAVSYSKIIKHDYTEDNLVKKVLQLVWKSGLKSSKKRLTNVNRKLRNAVYPSHVESFWVISMLVMGLHFASKIVPFNLVNVVAENFPR